MLNVLNEILDAAPLKVNLKLPKVSM